MSEPTASAVPVIAPVAEVIESPLGNEPVVTACAVPPDVPHKAAAEIPAPLPLSNKETVVSAAFVKVTDTWSALIASANSADSPEPFVTFIV